MGDLGGSMVGFEGVTKVILTRNFELLKLLALNEIFDSTETSKIKDRNELNRQKFI